MVCVFRYSMKIVYPKPPTLTRDEMIKVHEKIKAYILSRKGPLCTVRADDWTDIPINGMTLRLFTQLTESPPFKSELSICEFSKNISMTGTISHNSGFPSNGISYNLPEFNKQNGKLISGLLDDKYDGGDYSYLKSIIDVIVIELPEIVHVFNSIDKWRHSITVQFDDYNDAAKRMNYTVTVQSEQTVYDYTKRTTSFSFSSQSDVSNIQISCTAFGFSKKIVPFGEIEAIIRKHMKAEEPPPPAVQPPPKKLSACYIELEQRIDTLLLRMNRE